MTVTVANPVRLPSVEAESLVGNYFVAVYPPFFAWAPTQLPALAEVLARPATGAPLGLYVHVPFCQRKCDYCYYLSYVGQSAETVDRYVAAVVQEANRLAQCAAVRGRPARFLYVGGGTPSTLTSRQVRRLAGGLREAFGGDDFEEVTFECAPRSVRADLLETLRDVGVTRLSLGVQSFDDTVLALNGRIHLRADVERAFAQVRNAGFEYVNLDLMSGMLGETAESWRDSVRRVIALGPESVTIYQMEMPFNTQLYRDYRQGRLAALPVSWETKRARLSYAFEELARADYTVVSAYSAVRDPARHRFLYQQELWGGADMLGLGVAAFGYVGGVHYQNRQSLAEYLEAVERGEPPPVRAYSLSQREQLVREFILQLKWGEVRLSDFRDKFGLDLTEVFAEPLEALEEAGLVTVSDQSVRLTGDGLLRVDRLLPCFYDAKFQNVRYT
jgi:oxygen-independent coproporphyrinogen-3 oxidase